jgi:hypothetical protein
LAALSDLLQQAQAKGIKSAIILSCANNHYPLKETNQLLQTSSTTICGAVFPQLIFAGKIYDQGVIIIGLQQSIIVNTIEYISTDIGNLDNLSLTKASYKKPDNKMFLLLFVDGISKGAEYFIDLIYEYFGTCCNIIGAGAGCHELTAIPCIYSNEGILQDSAQVVQIPKKINSAIQHGWNYLAGSFLVTSATKNRIHELDYQPAYQVYKEALQSSANIDIEKNSFAKTASLFPLGMEILDDGIIVRDPINRKDNDLICVGDIPVFSNIIILERNKKSLIKATHHSVELAKSGIKKNTNGFLLLFDCYSRKAALGKHHKTTIAAINKNEANNTPYIGVLSIGEIMSSTIGSLHLHSKSTLAAFIS